MVRLIQKLRQQDIGFAFIYCNYQQEERHTARNLIGSIIQQLATSSVAAQSIVVAAYEHHEKSATTPTLSELTSLLKRMCSTFTRAFVVIDALDELSEHRGSRSTFLEQMSCLTTDMNMMILSRPLPDIRAELDGWAEVPLVAPAVVVRDYLRERMLQNKQMKKHFELDPILMPDAVEIIVDKSSGMSVLDHQMPQQ